MRIKRQASIESGQAMLIVTYGGSARKHHTLEGDLVVLGRAPTCDISLVSPEVAPVHCILQRGRDGWRARDSSGGRHATRLNGRPIQEEALRDTDVLQIGTFIFEVRLPSRRFTPVLGSTPVVDERVAARFKHLQRSRRNLVRLALRLRHRHRRINSLPPTLAELERQSQALRALQHDYEALAQEYQERLSELEKAEREVCDERAAFESERAERQALLDQAEHDLARKKAEREPCLQPSCASSTEDALMSEWAASLDRRSQELDCFARYLRRWRQRLLEQTTTGKRSGEIRISRDRNTGEGVGDRLAQLPLIKQAITGLSASAPGDKLRVSADLVMDPAQGVVD